MTTQLDDKYILRINGREFVKYEGLLSLAHQKGLDKLEVTPIQYPNGENGNEACQRPPKTSHYWPPENQPFLGGICHHLLFIKEKMDGEFSEDGFVEFNQGFAGQGMVA